MRLLKRLIKVLLVISLFILFIPVCKEINIKIKTNDVIKNNDSEYLGYIYIPKFEYKNIIDNKNNTLDSNQVLLTNFSNNIGEEKIILAGHNNRYVFNKIYNLDIDDQIIISDFSIDYSYKVKEKKIIKVDDFSYFDKDGLYLMTCTDNNQERFIIYSKREY